MILFRRDFRGLTGGHLKVWHYLRHATASRTLEPRLFLEPSSLRDASNPFLGGATTADDTVWAYGLRNPWQIGRAHV